MTNPFQEYVDRVPTVAEHEASERAAHIYRRQAQAERERADAAERDADAALSYERQRVESAALVATQARREAANARVQLDALLVLLIVALVILGTVALVAVWVAINVPPPAWAVG